MLAVPDAAVTCECRRMGGGFGGKESQAAQWACLAALATHVTGRPAKCRLDRDEDMIMTGKRHDFRISSEAGFDDDGRVTAVNVEFDARCGCSADLSQGVNDRTMFHADNAYFYPSLRIHSRRLRTNTVSNTAFRGFGGPQGMVFAERLMESIAVRTRPRCAGCPQAQFLWPNRDITPYGQQVTDNILAELVGQLERTSRLPLAAAQDHRLQSEQPHAEKRPVADTSQIRHLLHADPHEPGGSACTCLH